MVLVDTSVWVRFLAGREPFASRLADLLQHDDVLAHDLVEGELLIGDRGGWPRLLGTYGRISRAQTLPHADVIELVRSRNLHGRGIGWIDAHLLASALITHAPLWTVDSSLAVMASELGIGYLAS